MRRAAGGKEPRRNVLGEGKLSDYRSRGEHLPRCVSFGARNPNVLSMRMIMLVGLQQGDFLRHLNWRGWSFLGKADSGVIPPRFR